MPRETRKGQGLPDRRGAPKGSQEGVSKFIPTENQREYVALHAAYGTPYVKICSGKPFRSRQRPDGISEDTLVRHFRAELDEGLEIANAQLGSALFNQAKSGNVRAIDSWFDRRGGNKWKRVVGKELGGPDGGPIRYSDMSDEEIDARLEQLEKKKDGDGTNDA